MYQSCDSGFDIAKISAYRSDVNVEPYIQCLLASMCIEDQGVSRRGFAIVPHIPSPVPAGVFAVETLNHLSVRSTVCTILY